MHTWPELLAHLKQLEKLVVVKHQGSKRKELETRIADLQAQVRTMSTRELGTVSTTQKDSHLVRSSDRVAV
jgi:hypothetical protein